MMGNSQRAGEVKKIAVVGAGLSGAVIAHELAKAGCEVDIYEARPHVAGNCHTERDPRTGIMVHTYGPHIFHTSNARVWDFIRQFDEFLPFTNRVKAITGKRVFSLPINLLTINQFFGKTLTPSEAAPFIASLADGSVADPQTFEEQALRFVGKELYEAFFKNYTIKQWGLHPSKLPASILKRLPVRLNYDDNYYASTHQGMPRHGYTHVVEKMLDHPGICVQLSRKMHRRDAQIYHHVFYSGAIDAWFDCDDGPLGYRTLDFVKEYHTGDFQGNAVMNYCDDSVPWTRICEHKHFSPWETHDESVIFKEFSRACGTDDTPYYPIRLVEEKSLLGLYVERARTEPNTSFVGRLGTYRYLDMHIAVAEALEASERFLRCEAAGIPVPAFFVDPL